MIKLIKNWKLESTDKGYIGVTTSVRIVAWGLVPIIDSSNIPKEVTADVEDWVLTTSDFARNNVSRTMTDGSTLDGLILVVGVDRDKVKATDKAKVIKNVPPMMLSVGVRDAVAMDGSTSAMMGSDSTTYIEPDLDRKKMEKYGLCCLPRK